VIPLSVVGMYMSHHGKGVNGTRVSVTWVPPSRNGTGVLWITVVPLNMDDDLYAAYQAFLFSLDTLIGEVRRQQ
jgi:hypothetical protein